MNSSGSDVPMDINVKPINISDNCRDQEIFKEELTRSCPP